MIKIIMIEDDNEIASLLKEYLYKFNIELINFENSKKGLEAISNNNGNNFDVLILDLTLPDIDGLEVCKLVSEISDIPIIISSARSDDADIVTGLEIGADDYVSKPYNPRELVARIRSVIRRKDRLKHAKQMPDGTYIPDESSNINICSNNNIKHFEIDEDKMIIKKEEKILDLTSAEYELFSILLKNKDRVITRDFILENMKTMNYESIDRSVDVIIGRIRKKISDDPKNPKHIKSIRGYGYKFVE
jgi:two-component system OmpR family response regulator